MVKVSAVIVNSNSADLLRDCLENLLSIDLDLEIILVDNESTDGSPEMVKNEYQAVKLIETKNNGLSAGYNLGTKASTGLYLLYLGSDSFPTKDTVAGIVNYLEKNSEVGLATSKLVMRDGTVDLDAHRGFPTLLNSLFRFSGVYKLFPKSKFFNSYFLGHKNFEEPQEIDACISHFMMVRRSVYDEVGGWDEDYFLYGEDIDFCYRIKEKGWKIMYLPQWETLHYKGGTVGTRAETKDIVKKPLAYRLWMRRLTTDAMILFVEKHYRGKYPLPLYLLMKSGMFLLKWLRLGVEVLKR